MSEKPKCAGSVWGGRIGLLPCYRHGKFKEGGKRWCGIHLPSKVKAKQAERDAKWEAEWERKEAQRDRERAIESARDALIAAALAWGMAEATGREFHEVRKALRVAVAAYRKATEGEP